MPIAHLIAISSEATAAILGALAGGGIALLAQWLTGGVGALINRRRAAQLIFAELLGNLANAIPATEGYGWSSTRNEAMRAAWDTYGARLLLPWHHAHDIGSIASAYNRVDDIAWLAATGAIERDQDYSGHILDIVTGLYLAGRASGYSDYELEQRTIPVRQVRGFLGEARGNAKAVKRRSRAARLRSVQEKLRVSRGKGPET